MAIDEVAIKALNCLVQMHACLLPTLLDQKEIGQAIDCINEMICDLFELRTELEQ